MIDFSECERNMYRGYDGANGEKISIYYKNEIYMLKFTPILDEKNKESNACISEYVACKIGESLGLKTQKVLLGTYKNRQVVACKDFEIEGNKLLNFTSVKNSLLHSDKLVRGLDLESILKTLHNQEYVEKKELKKYFWEMFILDTLIGNGDRHNGNWGILVNEEKKENNIAPIYDCGSSFHTHYFDEDFERILSNKNELNDLIMGKPRSAIKINNRGLNYYNFLTVTDNKDCLKALVKITKKIDMDKINRIIDETPYISDIHKKFLKTIVKERKEKILDKAIKLNKNIKIEKNKVR